MKILLTLRLIYTDLATLFEWIKKPTLLVENVAIIYYIGERFFKSDRYFLKQNHLLQESQLQACCRCPIPRRIFEII